MPLNWQKPHILYWVTDSLPSNLPERSSPPPHPTAPDTATVWGAPARAADFKACPVQLCMSIPSYDTTVIWDSRYVLMILNICSSLQFLWISETRLPVRKLAASMLSMKSLISVCFTNLIIWDNQSQKHLSNTCPIDYFLSYKHIYILFFFRSSAKQILSF